MPTDHQWQSWWNNEDCDCTYNGNTQIIGDQCKQRIKEVWTEAIHLGEHLELGEN